MIGLYPSHFFIVLAIFIGAKSIHNSPAMPFVTQKRGLRLILKGAVGRLWLILQPRPAISLLGNSR